MDATTILSDAQQAVSELPSTATRSEILAAIRDSAPATQMRFPARDVANIFSELDAYDSARATLTGLRVSLISRCVETLAYVSEPGFHLQPDKTSTVWTFEGQDPAVWQLIGIVRAVPKPTVASVLAALDTLMANPDRA